MFITLYEAEVGAIKTVISNLENAKTKAEKKKYTNQIISYLYTVKAKLMAEKKKEEVLESIQRSYKLSTNTISFTFRFAIED